MWNLSKFQLIQLIQTIVTFISSIWCLIELKFWAVSGIYNSNSFWKFQLSILKNKKVLYLKKKFKPFAISKSKKLCLMTQFSVKVLILYILFGLGNLPWACCILMLDHNRFLVKTLPTSFANMTFISQMFSIKMFFQIELFIKCLTTNFTLKRSAIMFIFWMMGCRKFQPETSNPDFSTINPIWHEGWYFYLLIRFGSDFVSWLFYQKFPNFVEVKIDINSVKLAPSQAF